MVKDPLQCDSESIEFVILPCEPVKYYQSNGIVESCNTKENTFLKIVLFLQSNYFETLPSTSSCILAKYKIKFIGYHTALNFAMFALFHF